MKNEPHKIALPDAKKSVGQNMMRLLTQKEAVGVSGAGYKPTSSISRIIKAAPRSSVFLSR